MQVKFYACNKRENSTLVPESSIATYSCKLKDSVSYMNPVIICTDIGFGNMFNGSEVKINMCSFGGKYYKIIDVTQMRTDLWKISCELDVLATFKDDIKKTSAYIAYANTTNTEITDNRFPMKKSVTRSGTLSSLADNMVNGGHYFLSVTGNGKTATYALSLNALNRVTQKIEDWAKSGVTDIANINEENALTNLSKGMYKLFVGMTTVGSATDNIRGCIWHPWSIAGETGANEAITIGNYETGVQGYRIDTRIVTFTNTVKIPWQFNDWRNREPYTRLYLYLPYIGFTSLSASELQGIANLRVMYSVDLWTGALTVEVSAATSAFYYPIATFGGHSGANVPLGITAPIPANVANTVSQTAAMAVTGGVAGGVGGAIGAGLATLGANIGSSLLQPTNVTIGGLGNSSAYGLSKTIALYSDCNTVTDNESYYGSVIGVPVCATHAVSEFTGYVRTTGFSISLKEPFSVIRKINTMMDGGVYIE